VHISGKILTYTPDGNHTAVQRDMMHTSWQQWINSYCMYTTSWRHKLICCSWHIL